MLQPLKQGITQVWSATRVHEKASQHEAVESEDEKAKCPSETESLTVVHEVAGRPASKDSQLFTHALNSQGVVLQSIYLQAKYIHTY